MTKEQAAHLLARYSAGHCTPAEQQAVESWLLELETTGEWNATEAEKVQLGQALHQEILLEIARPAVPVRSIRKNLYRALAAAVVLIAVVAAWLLTSRTKNQPVQPIAMQTITPGSNKAILTLSDGRTIVLDSTANGVVGEQNGMQMINLVHGQLTYNKPGSSHPAAAIAYNTLTTPRGGQYQVVLPDGTRVWLNAASSITYPTVFPASARTVTVSGEAYLEVEKDATRPFSVRTQNQQVAVLGTSFNINAYENETTTRTTLLEGSISVSNPASSNPMSAMLTPGQQAILNAAGLKVQEADTEAVLAWKNGLFHFSSAGIEDIMRQVARWYDIEVVYEGKITTDRFSGKVARSANISEVLKVLQESGVRFKIENQKIIVLS
jgi:ferric-dicitrate binding protein FerR (iron transport regulator)